MNTLPATIALAQEFLRLAKYKKTGVLRIVGDGEQCRVAIVDGNPRAVTPISRRDDTLGDSLMRAGELDCNRHLRALDQEEPQHPVGVWLVNKGVASSEAVRAALQRQMRSRLYYLFDISMPYCYFKSGDTHIGIPLLNRCISTLDFVLEAIKTRVSLYSTQDIVAQIGTGQLCLSSLGKSLIHTAQLLESEQQMVDLLRIGCSVEDIRSQITKDETAVFQTLYAFSLMGMTRHSVQRRTAYHLLLRKQRQLRNHAEPDTLLDLPKGATATQARKALRRLALRLHPDALGPDAPKALQNASKEVMTALCCAERDLRQREYSRNP